MSILKEYEEILGGSYDFLMQIGPKYDSYKARAKRKGLKFNLSFAQFDSLVKKPCHYCGFISKAKPMGIDRVINTKGYTYLNSVPCCWTCNRAKSDLSYNEFKDYLKRFKKGE